MFLGEQLLQHHAVRACHAPVERGNEKGNEKKRIGKTPSRWFLRSNQSGPVRSRRPLSDREPEKRSSRRSSTFAYRRERRRSLVRDARYTKPVLFTLTIFVCRAAICGYTRANESTGTWNTNCSSHEVRARNPEHAEETIAEMTQQRVAQNYFKVRGSLPAVSSWRKKQKRI